MEPDETQDLLESQEPKANKPDPSGVTEPYPGFGKRHDIFYQYEPPDADTMPAAPTKPYMPPPPEYLAQLPPEETYEEVPRGHKKLLVITALLLTLVGAGVAFAFLHGKKNTPATTNNSASTNTQNPDVVSTACYTFTLPKPHSKITASEVCSGTYTSNGNDITVTPIALPYASLDNLIAAWKTSNSNNTIISQNPANFGTYSAEQIYWNPPGTPNEEDMSVLTLTIPDQLNPKYTTQGAPVYAFEIDGRYDSQSSSKTVYDSILSSWSWK